MQSSESAPRVIYIHPGDVPPQDPPERNAAFHLSRYLSGDLITVSWDTLEKYREKADQYERRLGSFGYHPSLRNNLPRALRKPWQVLFLAGKAVLLTLRNGRYSAIVAYGTSRTAWAGLVAKTLTRTPLIVEVVGNPFRALEVEESRFAALKARILRITLPFLFRHTDHLHVLYREQTLIFEGMPMPDATAFPNFTPTSLVPVRDGDDDFILFLGFPWHLKGVDILIEAFNRISDRFPDIRLKVVGHCLDRTPFERIAAGNPQVEFSRAVPHDQAMSLMSRCRFFVLPSRTEAMGRVILEAWAAGKPVVASAVDGIPYLVRHGEDGLLFPLEDVEALAGHMATLLEDPERARRLGRSGQGRIAAEFSEECYARRFYEMILAHGRHCGRDASGNGGPNGGRSRS